MLNLDVSLSNADWTKRTPDRFSDLGLTLLDETDDTPDLRDLGGVGSGIKGHTAPKAEIDVEIEKQTALALAQKHVLAHPQIILGFDGADSTDVKRYVAAYGEEFKAAALPNDIAPGTPKECYKNASLLLMDHSDLTYAEGYVKTPKTGDITFLHGWAVTKDGTVVDPTLIEPEKNVYFGVAYDRTKYLRHMYKAKMYGVIAGSDKERAKAIQTGGRLLRDVL